MQTPERRFSSAPSRKPGTDTGRGNTQAGRVNASGYAYVLGLTIVTAPLFLQRLCEDAWFQAANIVLL